MFDLSRPAPEPLTNRSRQSVFVILALLITTFLSACGGGGGGGSTPTTDPTTTTTETAPDASDKNNPAPLTIETTYSDGISAAGTLYYQFTTDSRTDSFIVDMQSVSTSYVWTLYSDPAFTMDSVIDTCHQYDDSSDCEINTKLAANTTYYLSLQEAEGSKDSFTIAFNRILTSEGSLDAPLDLTVGTSYKGTLGEKKYSSSVVSYYTFTTNLADGPYTISLGGATTDVKWELYIGGWNATVLDCDDIWDVGDERCTTPTLTGNTEYYLMVETQGPEATFVNIDITEGGTYTTTTSDEGTSAAPVTLTLEQPYKGSVSPGGTSYYQFTTSDVAASYLIEMEHVSTSYDIMLYSDSGFTNEIDNTYRSIGYTFSDISWRTIILDPNSTFYMKVVEPPFPNRGDEYQLTVSPDTPADPDSEGTTITPVNLTFGVPYTTGTVGGMSTSYYQFTMPEAKSYRISLTNSSTDLTWSARNNWDDLYSIKLCDNNYGDAGDEICDITYPRPNAGSTIYLAVNEYRSDVSGTFNLLVETIEGEGEGTTSTPVAITPGISYVSSVGASFASYYAFTTGPEKMVYRIGVTNATSDTEWELRLDSDSTLVASCDRHTTTADDEICDTSPLLPNTTYRLMVNETDGVRTDVTISVDTGTSIQTLPLDTVVNDTVDGYSDDAFYKFTTNSVDTGYTISISEDLTNNLNDVSWSLYAADTYYTDSGIKLVGCTATAPGTQDISCTVTGLSTNTTYYLHASTSYMLGVSDTYDIIVHSSDFSDGRVDGPVPLTLGAAYSGTVSSKGSSYYTFSTVSGGPSLDHTIDYNGDSETYLRLYGDAAFTSQIAYCYTNNGTMGSCTFSSLSPGATYYVEVDEQSGYAGSFTMTIN